MKRKGIIKENSKKEVGITLVALVITIVVLLILASVAAYSGMESLRSANLTLFTTQLKIMQTHVNQLYQKMGTDQEITVKGGLTYKGEEIKNIGVKYDDLDTTSKGKADTALNATGVTEATDKANFKYYNKELLKKLGIEGVDQDVLVNLEKRKVVSYEGFKYDNKIYYTLDDVPNKDTLYNVDYSQETANPTFDIYVEKISGEDRWKISIENIQNNGNINKWQVQYQKVDTANSNFWNTTNNMDFIVKEKNKYKIKIVNETVSSDEETLDLSSDIVVQNSETTVYLPTGATVTNNDLNTGFTIKDVNQNEWTWVQVPKNVTSSATDDAGIETALQNYATDYRLSGWTDTWYDVDGGTDTTKAGGMGLSSDRYNELKSAMLQSIKKYGGFYVGKYETGDSTTTAAGLTGRTDASGVTQTAVIKQDMYPYDYVTCGQAETLAEGLKPSQDKKSSLMFGIQWDLICKYIEEKGIETQTQIGGDSSNFGNFYYSQFTLTSGKYCNDGWHIVESEYFKQGKTFVLISTGAYQKYNALNIFDISGNVWEHTLEKNNNGTCAIRGGGYNGDVGALGYRLSYHNNIDYKSNDQGFRATFY